MPSGERLEGQKVAVEWDPFSETVDQTPFPVRGLRQGVGEKQLTEGLNASVGVQVPLDRVSVFTIRWREDQ